MTGTRSFAPSLTTPSRRSRGCIVRKRLASTPWSGSGGRHSPHSASTFERTKKATTCRIFLRRSAASRPCCPWTSGTSRRSIGSSRRRAVSKRAAAFRTSHYETYGPSCLFPRTYFGARLVTFMDAGVQRLSSLRPSAKWLTNGSAEVNLLPSPWSADPSELKQAQQLKQRRWWRQASSAIQASSSTLFLAHAGVRRRLLQEIASETLPP